MDCFSSKDCKLIEFNSIQNDDVKYNICNQLRSQLFELFTVDEQ